jgi:hypothetical protein
MRIWPLFGGIIYGLAIVGALATGVAVGDRNPPITVEAAKALEESAPQGGTIDIEYQVYRWRICDFIAHRYLVDSAGERHAIGAYTLGLSPFAGRETFKRTITIPKAAALGQASYQVTTDYYCNPFHRLGFPITLDAPQIHFEITPETKEPSSSLPNQFG